MTLYKDIVPDYMEYKRLQSEDYLSYESEVERWREPQRLAIQELFQDIPRDSWILDAACGDGVGLTTLKEMGFQNIIGVELNRSKATMAFIHSGAPVFCYDLHDFSIPRKFDIVYSSHTLEHCYYPGKVIDSFYQHIQPNGKLIVILPYPDYGVEDAHGGKFELGTNIDDEAKTTCQMFLSHGFITIDKYLDKYRDGPEAWFIFRKEN